MRRLLVVLLLVTVATAGCSQSQNKGDKSSTDHAAYEARLDAADGLYHYAYKVGKDVKLEFAWAPGALSHVTAVGGTATVGFEAFSVGPTAPTGPLHQMFLLSDDGQHLTLNDGKKHTLADRQTLTFLPPPGRTTLNIDTGVGAKTCCYDVLDPAADGLPLNGTRPIVSGANMIALEEYQQAHFPHRSPGQPNYALSQQYFSKYFSDLGYQVSVD